MEGSIGSDGKGRSSFRKHSEVELARETVDGLTAETIEDIGSVNDKETTAGVERNAVNDKTSNLHIRHESVCSVTSKVSIEDGLHHSGSCGRFQVILQVLLMFFVLCIGYISYFSYFILDDPPWKCVDRNATNSNVNHTANTFCQLHGDEIFTSDSKHFDRRCSFKRAEWKYTTSKLYSAVTEFDLVCDKASAAVISSSTLFLGGIFGGIISGRCADAYGRKPVMVICLLLNVCSAIACAFVTRVWQLIVLRTILGASWLPIFNVSVVYLMEYVSPDLRALSGLMYQATYSFSVLLIDGVAYLERFWRKLQLYVALPSILALLIFLMLPESPRWLLAANKITAAENTLNKVARYNGKSSTWISLKPPLTKAHQRWTYVDLFRHFKITLITITLGMIWLTSALTYFALGLESSRLGGDMYAVFAFSLLAELPGCFVSVFLCDRFGRKKTILGSLLVAGVLTGAISLVPMSYPARYIINIVFAVAAKFFINVTYMSVYVWTFEIYPTVIRTQGLSVCAIFERLGGFCAPFLVRLLQNVSYILPFVTMCILSMVTVICALVLPETNKMPTREVYEDFFKKNTTVTTVTTGDVANTEMGVVANDMGVNNEIVNSE